MKKLIFAALLFAAPAYAQTAEGSPDDTEARVHQDKPGEAKEGAEAEDKDPTRHFNFANVHYLGKDEYGGTFGDGEQIDPDGAKHEEEKMSPPFVFLLVNFGLFLPLSLEYAQVFLPRRVAGVHLGQPVENFEPQ